MRWLARSARCVLVLGVVSWLQHGASAGLGRRQVPGPPLRGGSNEEDPSAGTVRVASLFRDDEVQFQKFAAALAATEPLRELRDEQAKKCLKPWQIKLAEKRQMNLCNLGSSDPRGTNGPLRQVCATHVTQMKAVVSSFGLSIGEFNALARTVRSDSDLRSRVKKQVYLYRLAAAVGSSDTSLFMDVPAMPGPQVDPTNTESPFEPTPSLPRERRASIQTFALASHRVEQLRQQQATALKQELDISNVPSSICSQEYLPLLSPRVRGLCESFPHEARSVVLDSGMDVEQFNDMVARVGRNPFLRWRLASMIRKHHHVHPKPVTDGGW